MSCFTEALRQCPSSICRRIDRLCFYSWAGELPLLQLVYEGQRKSFASIACRRYLMLSRANPSAETRNENRQPDMRGTARRQRYTFRATAYWLSVQGS
jgi:hypothetical protein